MDNTNYVHLFYCTLIIAVVYYHRYQRNLVTRSKSLSDRLERAWDFAEDAPGNFIRTEGTFLKPRLKALLERLDKRLEPLERKLGLVHLRLTQLKYLS